MADGGRIFPISPPQPRFNRESVAFFNASCGPLIERGGLLPAAYHGNAFVCEPLSNLVHRRVLEPAGVTFVARRVEQGREFLASTDPAFRPVNLANGPDGALYVVDMYRELVEHPQFVPESAAGLGRLPPLARPRADLADPAEGLDAAVDRRPNLRKADDRTLVALLGQSQRLVAHDGAAAAGRARLVRDGGTPPSPIERSSAHCGPEGVAESPGAAPCHVDPGGHRLLSTIEIVSRMTQDPHPGLREHALRVGDTGRSSFPTEWLVRLADDPAIRVRLQAALALGDRCHHDPAALAALARIAARDAADPWMRLAILSGLAESARAFIPLCDRDRALGGSFRTAVAVRRDRRGTGVPAGRWPVSWR